MQMHNLPGSIKYGVIALVVAAASMGGYMYRGTLPISEAKAASLAQPAPATNPNGEYRGTRYQAARLCRDRQRARPCCCQYQRVRFG